MHGNASEGAASWQDRIIVGIVACVTAMTASIADAQELACTPYLQQGCLCVAPLPAAVLGRITSATGEATIAGAANFTPANVPAELHLDDGILIGPDGKVAVTFGSACQNRLLPAPANVSIRQIQGTNCACLRADTGPPPLLLRLGTAGIVGGVATYLIQNGNDPLSP